MRAVTSRFSAMGNNVGSTAAVVRAPHTASRQGTRPKRFSRNVVAYASAAGNGDAPGALDPAALELFNPATGESSPLSDSTESESVLSEQTSSTVAATLEREMSAMEPAVLADTLWAYTLSREYDPGVYDAVVQVVSQRMDEYDATSLIDVLCALAEAGHESENFYTACSAHLAGRLRDLPPSALSNLVWCFAYLRLTDQREVLLAAAQAALPKVHDFSHTDLAKLVAGLAQALPLSPAMVAPLEPFAIIQALQPDPEDTDSLDKAKMVIAAREARELAEEEEQAAAKLSFGFEKFMDAAAARFMTWLELNQLPAESCSQVVWAYLSLDLYRRDLFDAVRTSLLAGKASELNPQALSNCLWAFATARAVDEAHRSLYDVNLMTSLFEVGRKHMDPDALRADPTFGFSASSIVTILVALSRAPHYDATFYNDLARALLPKIEAAGKDSPMDLVMAAWAIGRMQHRSAPRTLAAIFEEAMKYRSMYDSEDLLHLASAMASTGSYHEGMMKMIAGTAVTNPAEFDSTQLLDLVRILANVQHHDQEYYEAAQESLLSHANTQFKKADVSAFSDQCGAEGGV